MKSLLITTLVFSLLGGFSPPFALGAEPSVQLRPRGGGMKRRNYSFKPQPKKPAPAVAPKFVGRPTPVRRPNPTAAIQQDDSDLQPVKISLFPKDGNVPLGSLNAVVVSSRVVAARLDKKDDFQYYARRLRVLISGTKYVSLKLSDMDLASGWLLFQADENLPMESPPTFPKTLPASLGGTFGYNDQWEFAKDWGNVIDRLRNDRAIASRLTPGMIIERELSDLEQQNLPKFVTSTRKLEIEKFALSPMGENFVCVPGNVKVKGATSTMVSGASSVSCKSAGAEGSLGLRVEAGVIDFWANREFTNDAQSVLLDDLASAQFREHKIESERADNSTHSVCQKTRITDNSVEIHYCTRTLRAAPNFQDTVVIFGKRSRAKFLYTILRTGALSESNTKKAIQSVMNALEENP